ncbi:MAG: single-stranded-DNA-specific exonuclease RecJ [Clostridiales bacterium]|nr:single-stranded-DNA-specific exonuclease RecJ [Clostridiales bacterium]
MSHKDWKIPEKKHKVSHDLEMASMAPLLREVLLARDIDTPEKAEKYLSKDLNLIHDPFLLQDMDKAKDRINLAVSRGEKVTVYGDYDVDGISSACLLCDYLRGLGLCCDIYIPDRLEEGYGLNPEAIKELSQRGTGLIITVDCGITAVYETELAKKLGIDLIITEHHECPTDLPSACAVINPRRQDSTYPFDGLAGVGVAFKLACAMEGESESVLGRYSDLIALGTIADVMPLKGENRALVYEGLKKLKNSPRLGLAALLHEAGADKRPLSTATVSFVLAPRINAAGRLSQAEISTSLLLSQDEKQAREYAKKLCEMNLRRQELEMAVWEQAQSRLEKSMQEGPIVLESEDWHSGVVGIAASRLAETYRLPVIIICLEGEDGKGSCRSYGGFNIFEAISSCALQLESFGGHAYAAGLNIKAENIPSFREAIKKYYRENIPEPKAALLPELLIENFGMLSLPNVRSLSELEPCGCENPYPIMCACDVMLESVSPIGNGRHLRLRVSKGGEGIDCVFFACSLSEISVSAGMLVDICFLAKTNEFRSVESVQLQLCGLRPAKWRESCDDINDIEGLRPFRPDRDELGRLWRIINSMGKEIDKSPKEISKMREFESFSVTKLCLGLKIFRELELVTADFENDRICAKVRNGNTKTELNRSPIFRLLWENGG